MFFGLLSGAGALLLWAMEDRGEDFESAVLSAFGLSAIMIAAGFAMWSVRGGTAYCLPMR